jgi:hypothetical protein
MRFSDVRAAMRFVSDGIRNPNFIASSLLGNLQFDRLTIQNHRLHATDCQTSPLPSRDTAESQPTPEHTMTQKARIEYQTQFGTWRLFTTVTVLGSNVHDALLRALALQNCAGKARAVDAEDGSLLDIQTG